MPVPRKRSWNRSSSTTRRFRRRRSATIGLRRRGATRRNWAARPSPALQTDDHRQTGRAVALLRLANVRKDEGKYDEALEHANEAVNVIEQGDKDYNTAYALTIRGTLRLRVGQYAEGAADFDKVLQIRQKTVGSDNPLTAVALRKRGNARRHLGGNLVASKNDYEAATRIFIKASGEESSDAIKAMIEMAETLLGIPGELDAAEGYSRRAHTAACKRFEDADDHVVLQEARAQRRIRGRSPLENGGRASRHRGEARAPAC